MANLTKSGRPGFVFFVSLAAAAAAAYGSIFYYAYSPVATPQQLESIAQRTPCAAEEFNEAVYGEPPGLGGSTVSYSFFDRKSKMLGKELTVSDAEYLAEKCSEEIADRQKRQEESQKKEATLAKQLSLITN
ncbi:hypothetical protein [Klebsiella pneumoniae]|uniref:hypothetical protein n=1 Tax=Klebsiella pneumoniae TaxID=573 RepID=UPI00132F6557|nr:hypothetical protein [Klebsiella pneumoniae]